MRVLVVTSQYHRGGGFPRYGTQLAVGLHRLGHEVTVLTRDAHPSPDDEGLRFTSYRVPSRPTLLTMAAEPLVLTRRLRREAPAHDVALAVGLPVLAPVVLFGTGSHRGYFEAALTGLRPRSWRWWFERLRPFHRVVMAWERAMLRGRHPRLVVVGAEPFRAEYLDLFGLPPELVVVVPLGVELGEFTFDAEVRQRTRDELGLPPSTRVLANVAGRGRQKGLDVLVAALDRLPHDSEWCALLAGNGSTSRRMVARTRQLVLEGRVRLLGRVPDVRALYCAADLLVFPSRYDPWGLVVTEALACGLPVVASSRAGASTVVRRGENGTIVDDPEDPDEVARRVEEVWHRPFDRDAVRRSVRGLDVEDVARLLEPHLARAAARP